MFTWYWAFLFFIFLLHIRMSVFSIFVHRGLAHKHFTFKPILRDIFRFYLWTWGYCYNKWMEHYSAQHRKHHKFTDTINDPHSPHVLTLRQMFDVKHTTPGGPYYISPLEIKIFAKDIKTPNDRIQQILYNNYPNQGIFVLWLLFLILYGPIGMVICAVGLFIEPYVELFLGNYVAHKWGYGIKKNDYSRNYCPIAILFGGEELHNNHHNNPGNPKFSRRWWEIDVSWGYVKLLEFFNLLEINSKPKNLT